MGWIKIRTLALISAGVASLSILSAGISGIPFFALLVRALISALAAAMVTIGVSWLIQRFLPELLQDSGTDSQRGGHVDITVQQDEDGGDFHQIGPQVPYRESDDEPVPDAEPAGGDTEVETVVPMSDPEMPRSFSDSGRLPDIGSFSSDFSSGDSEDTSSVPASESSSSDEDSDDGIGQVEHRRSRGPEISSSDDQAKQYFKTSSSPEEMAKAIRTIVKRDEN